MYGEGAEPLTVDKSPASLRTLVGIKLLRSHALLAWLGLFGLVCLVAGFFFLWHQKSGTWIPLLFGTLLLVPVIVGWFISRRDIDLADGTPTIYKDPYGNEVSSDLRMSLPTPDGKTNKAWRTLTQDQDIALLKQQVDSLNKRIAALDSGQAQVVAVEQSELPKERKNASKQPEKNHE